MGYHNPDFYYHKLLMDSAHEIAELKNENKAKDELISSLTHAIQKLETTNQKGDFI